MGKHGPKPFTLEQVIERFWKRVTRGHGCWEWQGSRTRAGYGQFQARGLSHQPILAHRFAYELYHHHPLPADVEVLHTCDNPPCVREEHLLKGDHQANMRDAKIKGRLKIGGITSGTLVAGTERVQQILRRRWHKE